ncbi:Mucin-associated surface protein (MASP) [Trypanosoma cruzi]|uniref:Mucin-associated surface protein (MASP), putative n=2 Tax=Trypanosoma cruzi TaxID=5693 RepID=Q4DBA2_TRYCC|nr:mucin-associated surface protein (MASP), putative [Trypanosoma cruzi]EAN89803.1 mucin-associated surface protein (MASP), putative [Trypanosoma cruzi]PWV20706.1 Mucin-associated surface protein (MASP) [Trypanosoma cruzi]|eukprot:XP_811654.1 mucin-associated surface protein (MASP) [Trypanosoma cruzi strain CL Brener]
MAMMAGRVLLVCALCVLWCGAVFGHAMEDYGSEGGGNGLRHTSNGGDDGVSLKADCVLLSTRMALIKAVEAADNGHVELSGVPDHLQDTGESSPNNTEGSAAAGPGGQPAGLLPKPEGSDTEGQQGEPEGLDPASGKKTDGKSDRKDGTATGPQHQRADQSSSSSSPGSSGTEGVKRPSSRANSESNEALNHLPQEEKDLRGESDGREMEAEEEPKKTGDKKNANREAPTETRGSPANNTEIQTATPPPPPAPMNGHSSFEDLPPMQPLQRVQDDNTESRPPSPTANADAANNDSEKSTENGMPNSDQASDAPGTAEEKQNENKDANPKETPVTATAMKTATATTGDSDGSTAVSHATSPLLLLLVVMCAAAAVVAA